MKNKIQVQLKEIASKQRIDILFACESGSRAWGFPSTDSDYDVRFIYKHKKTDYLSVKAPDEQLGFPISNDLDVYGWDIRKVLLLLYKSNCTPYEWIQSPITYQEQSGFRDDFLSLLPDYFNMRKQIFHYLGIAKGALETMETGGIKVKKLFYVLRPLLAAKWIAERNEYAPMNIEPLLQVAGEAIQNIVADMIITKAGGKEGDTIVPDEMLLSFIHENMKILSAHASKLEQPYFSMEKLNEFFIRTIQ